MSAGYFSETDRVRVALSHIPAHDREVWVEMAYAVKHGLGEAGFDLWDAWSQQAKNYDANAARAVWKSVPASGRVSLGSLFWRAGQHGFALPEHVSSHADPAQADRQRAGRTRREQSAKAGVAAGAEVEVEGEVKARREAAAKVAFTVWQRAIPARDDNPYLARKGERPTATLREIDAPDLRRLLRYAPRSDGQPLTGRVLVAPVEVGGKLSSIEFIDGAGRKSALAGGAKSGGYWASGPLAGVDGKATSIALGEGVATMLSIHAATGHASFAALSCHNLPKVAKALRERYPEADIVVLADRGNGQHHAERAALEARARLAVPRFAADERLDGARPTDFNDLARLRGRAAVAQAFADALPASPVALPGAWPAVSLKGVVHEGEKTEDVNLVHADPGVATSDGVQMDSADPEGSISAGSSAGRGIQSGERMMSDLTEGAMTKTVRAKRVTATKKDAPAQEITPSQQVAHAEPAASAAQVTQSRDVHASSQTARVVGKPLFELRDVPAEIRAAAQQRFGTDIRMGVPRENALYKGEVFNTDRYLVQEVATRSVVFHAKDGMEFADQRLKWCNENQRLNGADVQVGYTGDKAKVYPYDRQRDQLEKSVASLKKSVRELGFPEDLGSTLDALKDRSWERVKQARSSALEQAKARQPQQSQSQHSQPAGPGASQGPER